MANYKDIQGKTVKSYTSDPSNSYGAGFEDNFIITLLMGSLNIKL